MKTIIVLTSLLAACLAQAQTSTNLARASTNLAQASKASTNRVAMRQAIKIASGLRVGMSETETLKFLEAHGVTSRVVDTNGDTLIESMSVGSGGGWATAYPLADHGCILALHMRPSQRRSNGFWGGNGLLESASIQSNGITIVSIAFTNRP